MLAKCLKLIKNINKSMKIPSKGRNPHARNFRKLIENKNKLLKIRQQGVFDFPKNTFSKTRG